MPQVFPWSADIWLRALALAIVGGGLLGATALYGSVELFFFNRPSEARAQPVPFSHKHHAGTLGIDCRYCHNTVETDAHAGWPATEICMTCHSQLWTQAEMLAPVRQSLATGRPIHWRKVVDMPDYVYFNHSIHIQKGVGCSTCHGPVDEMPLTYPHTLFQMRWCLDCHRDPAPFLRAREDVFDMGWKPAPGQDSLGRRRIAQRHIRVGFLDQCDVCHR